MSPAILGLATAVPAGSIEQNEAAEVARRLTAKSEEQGRALAALYRRARVQRRGSVLLEDGRAESALAQTFFRPSSGPVDRGPSTLARGERYAAEAPRLALEAAHAALANAQTDARRITHLVTVSCTGFNAPGVDAELIKRLGLPHAVERTHVGFMGCHGAINGLRVANAFVRADPRARVLLCAVELCSLHFHFAPDPQQAVANALFADGAAAAIIGSGGPGARLAACASCLLPESEEAMTWKIGDHGFEMTLSPRVPSVLQAHLRSWLEPWLSEQSLAIGDVGSWAVHPGGPRILGTVAECLDLPSGATGASAEILAEHGNMSSPTVLFILERLQRRRESLPTLLLAFGPGLVAEAALLR